MTGKQTQLEERIQSGQQILIVEVTPPQNGDAEAVRTCAKRYAGKVHALGVSDNRDEVRMSALATALLIAAEGVEPILHVVTRDRNRIALSSECFGAKALGIRNLLCTSGTHQTLGCCRQARNVFDVDSVQLLQMFGQIASNDNQDALFLGAAASPCADPLELQVIKLAKKIAVGAKFVITAPVFDVERFEQWWQEITNRDLHKKACFIAGIKILTDAGSAKVFADRRPQPGVPEAVLERLAAKSDKKEQRSVGIEIACETIKKLAVLDSLRGFEIRSDDDDDAVMELIEKTNLRIN